MPSAQLVVVSSSFVGFPISYSVDDSDADWLYACTDASCGHTDRTPGFIGVAVDPSGLTEGRYTGTLVVRASGAPDVRIPVDFTIDPPNAVTSVKLSPDVSRFSSPQNTISVQQVDVRSPGKDLAWSLRRQTDSPWLKFSATSGTSPSTVEVTVDTTGLKPGSYSSLSNFVVTGGSTTLFIVTLTVTDARATMQVDTDSMLFEAVEGTTAASPKPVRIFNSGAAPLSWQLTIPPVDDQRRNTNWIRASKVRDTVQAGGGPSLFNISVDPAGLRSGTYSVPVVLTAPGAAGAPQVVGVRLRVLPAGTAAKPVFNNAALLFIGPPGARIDEQTVQLSSTGGALSFSSSMNADTAKWLSVSPGNGLVPSSSQAVALKFKIAGAGLNEGVYTGAVRFSFSDGSVKQVNVTLILRAGAGLDSARDPKSRAAGCQPTKQVLIVPSLSENFALNVGWPIPLQAEVFDDCGAPSLTSAVNVTFDNGDPVLLLNNLTGGRFAGTWTPTSSGAGAVSILMQALRPKLPKAEWRSSGRLSREASPPPILSAGGVLNAATRVNTSLMAPGGRLVLQGANFPESAADASVLIGGVSAKVVSSAANEMQVVAPAQLDGVTQTYVLVNARGFSTSPQTVTVVPADPGLYALPAGATVAVGGTVTVPATGLGAADSTGKVAAPITAKLGTLNATAAATAGADGMYQIQITIPTGASGAMPLSVTQNAVTSNEITVNVR